jgi:hypothetical protein
MAFTRNIAFTFSFNNLESCLIGDEGCEYLNRGKWPKIISIWLCLLIIIETVIRELLWWELKDWEKLGVRENKTSISVVKLKIIRLFYVGNEQEQEINIILLDKKVEMIDWAYCKISKSLFTILHSIFVYWNERMSNIQNDKIYLYIFSF